MLSSSSRIEGAETDRARDALSWNFDSRFGIFPHICFPISSFTQSLEIRNDTSKTFDLLFMPR